MQTVLQSQAGNSINIDFESESSQIAKIQSDTLEVTGLLVGDTVLKYKIA